MRFLVVSRDYPAFDRNSGDLRFINVIRLLRQSVEVIFCATAIPSQIERFGAADVARYRKKLVDLGVTVIDEPVSDIVRMHVIDSVVFEFYDVAINYIGFVRCLRPQCRIVIDTVDLHYERLERAAALSGSSDDVSEARRVRTRELQTYSAADVLIAVSHEEATKLHELDLGPAITVITNINKIHAYPAKPAAMARRLLFVGGFTHAPNEDGIVFFCNDILPLVLQEFPDVELQIVGNAPTESVRALANRNIKVIGYVPDVEPYLLANGIALAPLRFGAGMKGKVGEAMGYGLAVVTTTIGAEGFGLTPGVHAGVADTARGFADELMKLMRSGDAFESMRLAGWSFFAENFGETAVKRQFDRALACIADAAPRRPPFSKQLASWVALVRFTARHRLHRHLLWRFSA